MSIEIKLTLSQMALMDWLLERPGHRFVGRDGHGRLGPDLFEFVGEPNAEGKRKLGLVVGNAIPNHDDMALLERLGGRIPNRQKLMDNGFLSSFGSMVGREAYNRFMAKVDGNPHYAAIFECPTNAALEWWKTHGKAEYAKAAAKLKAQRDAVERVILIGRKVTINPSDFPTAKAAYDRGVRLPIMSRTVISPYATARVIKETATRFYVDNIKRVENNDRGYYPAVISGREPNQFVEREAVMLDNVGPTDVARIMELDGDLVESYKRSMQRTLDRIIPILEESMAQLSQIEAQRDDMMGELLARLASDGEKRRVAAASAKPETEPDEDADPSPHP